MRFTQQLRTKLRAVQKGQTKKFYALFLVLITIAGIYGHSLATSSLLNNVRINTTGRIDAAHITANSGSSEDIQAAVDIIAAIGVGTVFVPEGDFSFNIDPNNIGVSGSPVGVSIPGGVNVIGAGKNKTILYEPLEPPSSSTMFQIDGRNGNPVRISGIKFQGNVTTTEDYETKAIGVLGAKDFRIDHCSFVDFSSTAIYVSNSQEPYGINRGVIDHCDFDNPYKDIISGSWGYGIIPYGGRNAVPPITSWEPIEKYLGRYDDLNNVVYIEDCVFSRCRHAVASNGGAWYVVRYCNFSEPRYYPMIDVHGGIGTNYGGRGLEAYNNYIQGDPLVVTGYAFGIRGGGGVIFNNTIIDCDKGIVLSRESDPNPDSMVKDIWIWNNTCLNVTYPFTDQYGDYLENVDYYLYAKSGYIPYPYPHPLVTEMPEFP